MSLTLTDDGDVLEIRKKDLLIRKTRIGEREEWNEYGMVFDSYPIEVELVQGASRFRINDLLPPGWRILETDALENDVGGMCAKPGEGTHVAIPISEPEEEGIERPRPHLETDFSIPFLFHEIGHARRFASMTAEELEEFAEITDFRSGDNTIVTVEQGKLLKMYIHDDERRAWAYALRDIRRLRDHGIVAEPNVSNQALLAHVHECLGSYRKWLMKINVDLGR